MEWKDLELGNFVPLHKATWQESADLSVLWCRNIAGIFPYWLMNCTKLFGLKFG